MLRHFAVATVLLTVAIALFADENQRAPIEEAIAKREAQNKLEAKDAEHFGNHKLAAKASGPDTSAGFGADEPMPQPDIPTGGSVRGPMAPGPMSQPPAAMLPPPNLPRTPGASVTVRNVSGDYLPTAQGTTAKKTTPFRPNQKQIEDIHKASRERSGNPNDND